MDSSNKYVLCWFCQQSNWPSESQKHESYPLEKNTVFCNLAFPPRKTWKLRHSEFSRVTIFFYSSNVPSPKICSGFAPSAALTRNMHHLRASAKNACLPLHRFSNGFLPFCSHPLLAAPRNMCFFWGRVGDMLAILSGSSWFSPLVSTIFTPQDAFLGGGLRGQSDTLTCYNFKAYFLAPAVFL